MDTIPHLCTVSGLAPNQPFRLPDGEHNPYYIDMSGHIIGSNSLRADRKALEDFLEIINRAAYLQIQHACSEREIDALKAAQLMGFRFVGKDETGKVFFSVVNPAFCDREQVLGLNRMYPIGEVGSLFGFMHENTTMRILDAITEYLRK